MFSVPAAHGGVVLGIVPLATAAAAALVAHERPSLGFWLVSLVGAAIVLAFVLSRPQAHAFALGDLFLLGTVLSGAFGGGRDHVAGARPEIQASGLRRPLGPRRAGL